MSERIAPESDVEEIGQEAVAPPWMTILHNCDCHTFEQVVAQLQKAIGCSEAKGWDLAWQVHNTGKAVVKVGAEAECVKVGNVLAAIGQLVASLMDGTGLHPNTEPRPVVKQMRLHPPATSPVIDTGS